MLPLLGTPDMGNLLPSVLQSAAAGVDLCSHSTRNRVSLIPINPSQPHSKVSLLNTELLE